MAKHMIKEIEYRTIKTDEKQLIPQAESIFNKVLSFGQENQSNKSKESSEAEYYYWERQLDILENSYNEWKNRPKSFEKYINILCFLGLLIQLGKSKDKRATEKEIRKNHRKAFDRLEIEKERDKSIGIDILSCMKLPTSDNYNEFTKNILKIASNIRKLNIPECKQLYKKVKDASSIIKGKKIILLLGSVGAGKSTTMHYLAGSKMEKKGNHIEPVSNKENPDIIKQVKCCPYVFSETRYITAIPIKYFDGMEINEVVLVDTPGYQNTGSPEVDLINQIGVIKVISEATSVMPLIIISSYDLSNQLQGLDKFFDLIFQQTPTITDKLESMNFAITKFTDKNLILGALKIQLKRFNLITNDDDNFLFLNPLDDESQNILKQIMKSSKIKGPNN